MVSTDLIPYLHLHYLVTKYVADKDERTGWLRRCKDAKERASVLEYLETLKPGTRATLASLWTHRGGVAIHVWQLLTFSSRTAAGLKTLISKNLKHEIHWGERVELKGDARKSGERLRWILLTQSSLRACVRLRIDHTAVAEGQVTSHITTPDVEIVIDLDRTNRLAEVIATQRNADRALTFFFKKVLGVKLPEETVDRQKLVAPFKFTEAQVRKVSAKLKMDTMEVRGDDPEGVLGTCSFQSRMVEGRFQPLTGRGKAKDQIDATNDKRGLATSRVHKDGFEEYVVTQFYFSGKHPHLKFRNTTSRPMMRTILDALVEVVDEDADGAS